MLRDGGVWGRTQMHRVVGVKKGIYLGAGRNQRLTEVITSSRGKAEAKSRAKPGNPLNIKHKELKLKGKGLVNQRKLKKESTD